MTYRHPSGIDLSSVPGDHVLRPETTVADELRRMAAGLYGSMQGTAESFSAAREWLDTQRALRMQYVYDAQRRMLSSIDTRWHELGLPGRVLDWEVPDSVATMADNIASRDVPY